MGDGTVPDDWAHAPPEPPKPKEDEATRCKRRRDNARWTAAVGFLLLFAARFAVGFVIGGMLMAAYGAAASMYWSRRLRKIKGDPWAYDPELDGPMHEDWQRR